MNTVTETIPSRQTTAAELAPDFWPLDSTDPNDWPSWCDDDVWELSDAPAAVEARIAVEARELATPIVPAATIAVAAFRTAYRSLWARFVASTDTCS